MLPQKSDAGTDKGAAERQQPRQPHHTTRGRQRWTPRAPTTLLTSQLAASAGEASFVISVHMTMMVTMTSQGVGRGAEWAVAEAKAHFSEMIDRALSEGPQVVTRKGKRTVVVVPVDEWERSARRQGSLADFFAASPLRGSQLQTRRSRDLPRDVDL